MNCRNFHRTLEDYLDGGLDFAGRLGIERHAEQCFACGKELSDARGLRLLTASLARVKAPVDFESNIRREIVRRKSQGIFARVRNCMAFGFERRRLVFAAVVCAALAVGFFSARQFQQIQQIYLETPVPAVAENSNSAEVEAEFLESPDNFKMDALDLLLLSPGSFHTLEQLPREIHVRYGPPSEQYFIRNVSH